MAAVINQHFVDLAWAPVLPPAIPRAIRRPPVFAIPPALAPDAETLIARPHLRATAAFVRLSHARPWDLFTAPNPLWMRHVDIPLFTAWIAAHRRLRSSASAQSDMALAPLGLANIPADDDKLARKMAAWKNQGRVDAVCGPYVSRVASAPEPLLHASDKFSILVSTFNRIDTVVRLVKHYRQSPLVDTIFVTWHDPAREPPEPLRSIAHAVISDTDPGVDRAAIAASSNDTAAAVVLVRQTTDSLNNRFNPIGAIRTPGVLMIDDDIRIPLSQLDIGFAAWAAHQNLLVGYYPRSHEVRLPGQETPGAAPPPPYAPLGSGGPLDPQTWEFSYLYGPPHDHRRYSMMLTKGMFFHTSFLAAYTCLMPPHVHAYIDAIQNCEDIAMNFVVSGLTGLAPLTVNFPRAADSEPLEIMTDFGQHDGISGKTNHLNHRSQCLADLVRLFGTWPLVDTDIEAVRYTDAPPWVFDSLANWH
ncbi:hypothetical protein HK105_204748 [Polyrhizophydium stewartii]|uniref:Glycosyl transferase 64 domain-containing protein n=1 Tax=Polyrhizophydium stewartii TaxID=2732419 RepID=A0ABR4N8E5_9FUNG